MSKKVGIVYKIARNDGEGEFYIGSSFDWKRRMHCHKSRCTNEKDKNYNTYVYQYIRENGGWSNFSHVVLESIPYSDKISKQENEYALKRRERFHVEDLHPKLNMVRPMGVIDDKGKCEHDRIRSQCKECGGGSICEHNRQRCHCKECGGSSICEHNRRRCHCKECRGGSICEHGIRRCNCKECDPVKHAKMLERKREIYKAKKLAQSK